MTIRTKLLLLLLLIAVLPLSAVGLFDLITARQLGQRLADDRRRILTNLAYEQMQQLVESYGRVLQRDQQLLEHAVLLQAREVERRLAESEPSAQRLYFAADWEGEPSRYPPGTERSARHTQPGPTGEREPMPVSYQHQSFFVVRGVEPVSVEKDLRRLSTMPEAYRFINLLKPEQMVWQYTSLEVGIHSAFPGQGGYPADYDPRERPWYRRAREAGGPTWVLLPDVSTRTVSLTIATPVQWPDGRFAGVTAIDVPLTSLFGALQLPPRWADEAEAMLIGPGDRIGLPAERAVVLARQRYNPGAGDLDWRQPVEPEMLEVDDPARLSTILAAAEAGESGVERILVAGEPFLIAFGSGGVFPVVKVPELLLLSAVEQARQRVLSETRRRQVVGLVTLAVVLLGVVWLAFTASRKVTRPARRLAEAAQRLAEGDYDAQVEIKGQDELAQLGEVFNQIGPQLRERERIKHSLTVAMDVQRNLLPSTTPTFQGLDLAGHSTYCDETGGDYYDYLDIVGLDDRSVAVVVGDVMGHGVAAAMLMATARGILRSRCTEIGSLSELLQHLNNLLVEVTGGYRFMTMVLITIDGERGELRMASAGHDPPIVYRPDEDRFVDLQTGGLPLGIMPDEQYKEFVCDTLPRGAVVLASTDGVWEARNESKEMFGKERVCEIIRANADRSAQEIADAIVDGVHAFCGEARQLDDITFVLARLVEPSGG